MERWKVLLAIGCIVAAVLVFAVTRSDKQTLPPAETLYQAAIQPGTEAAAQREATRQLLGHPDASRAQFRQLASETQDTVVRATALQGLGEADDWESVPQLLAALEDDDPLVRGQAGAALKKIFRVDVGFRAHDPPEQRSQAIQEMRRRYAYIRQGYNGERSRE